MYLLLFLAALAQAQADLEFLRSEGQATTASRASREVARAPATVHVVTARQIRESGATTVWEALRGVPGVDVARSRTMQGEVSIRGMNSPLSNRTLVMVDGRSVLNGVYDFMLWERLPLSMEAIERIEVVEGPVSALYGPNALNGVINIITRSPEAVGRARAGVTAGEDGLLIGHALHGRKTGPWAYKMDLGWRSAGRFDNSSEASRAKLAYAMLERDFGEAGVLALSGGLNAHRTQLSAGAIGAPYDNGTTGFARGDWSLGATKARAYWNFGRTTFRGVEPDTALEYDTYDIQLERSFLPHPDHQVSAGFEYRRNAASSPLFGVSEERAQDLWAVFGEDSWAVADTVTLDLNGRLDRHPLTGYYVSPRGAVVWTPRPQHTLRASGGKAFRNPTLADNYVSLTQTQGGARFTRTGYQDLMPERATQGELAYVGQYERVRARLTAFAYRLRHTLQFSQPTLVTPGPPPQFTVPAVNVGGVRAWGGEAALDSPLGAGFSAAAGWSYQRLKDDNDLQSTADSAPRNKVSGSLTWRRSGWTVFTGAFWQSATSYRSNSPTQAFVISERVPDYWLLSARVAYAVGDWEAALAAWNLADRRHYELIPFQSGEQLRRQLSGSLAWRFR